MERFCQRTLRCAASIRMQKTLHGSLFCVHFCRLAFMDPNELINFPVSLAEEVIECLLAKAKEENLTREQFIQFTRINESNYSLSPNNSNKTTSLYKTLLGQYYSTYHDEQEGKMKKEMRMHLLTSIFKTCLQYIVFGNET